MDGTRTVFKKTQKPTQPELKHTEKYTSQSELN